MKVFPGNFKRASTVLHRRFKGVSREFKSDSREFQKYLKEIQKVFQLSFKNVLKKFQV